MVCTPVQQVYNSIACNALKIIGAYKPPATPHHAAVVKQAATLPFTGLDLVGIAFAGVSMIVLSITMRRLTRGKS